MKLTSGVVNVVLTVGWLACQGLGCANFVETRTIEKFTAALEAENVKQLRRTSSSDFEHKALRLDGTLPDFKSLRLPQGKTTVVKVEDVSDEEKSVTVAVGESEKKLKYRLTRDAETEKWVVDDILLRRERNHVTTTESVANRMDLLISVREFLSAWSGGQRDAVLAVASPEFQDVLSELPPVHLARLTQQVVGKRADEAKQRPKEEIAEDTAQVRLPRPVGEVVISFELLDDAWKAHDVRVESKSARDQIPSVRRLAAAVGTAVNFLNAYQQSDKTALSERCTETFFQNCLAASDLSLVSLPGAEVKPDDYELHTQGKHAYFTVKGRTEVVTIHLSSDDREQPADPAADGVPSEMPARFLVDEVTIYELEGTQEKRLSALFTAHAVVQIFSEALAARDLAALRHTATPEFQHKAWDRLTEQALRELPLERFDDPQFKIMATDFRGAVTEVTVMQDAGIIAYTLQYANGHLLVDDVLVPVPDRPSSLKQNLALIIPLQEFAAGIRLGDLPRLERSSSKEMNRLVWYQTKDVPAIASNVLESLQKPIRLVEAGAREARLELGPARQACKVHLVKEEDVFVVDDVEFPADSASGAIARFRQTLRQELTSREQRRAAKSGESTVRGSVAPNVTRAARVLATTKTPARGPRAPQMKRAQPEEFPIDALQSDDDLVGLPSDSAPSEPAPELATESDEPFGLDLDEPDPQLAP